MMRVLTCLGVVSVLLLTSFVTNVNAAEDFPTSDLGLPSSGVGASGEFREVKITLSGFPGQTGESVTNVGLTPSPCRLQNDITCTGFSHIVIPGIGEADTRLLVLPFFLLVFTFVVYELTVHPFAIVHVLIPFADQTSVTRTIDIPGIGTGQVTVELS